jgi:L-fuconolactonase
VIIDAHCHASSRWYEPVESLLFAMDLYGVDRALLIQILGSTDNGDMIKATRAHPDRFSFVAIVDPANPDWSSAVTRAKEEGAKGLRCRAAWRSPGSDPLAFWRLLEAKGLCVSLVGSASSFLDGCLEEVASSCPNLPLVLEHLGGIARPDAGSRAIELPAIAALAKYSNIALKVPGLGQLAPRLPSIDGTDLPLDMTGVVDVFQALLSGFGPNRLMWGSDFPPVSGREGYGHALNWSRDLVNAHWPDAAQAIFSETAASLFEA